MHRLESRVKRLEAQINASEEKVKLGDFGYFTRSEIRELLAAVAENAARFDVKP